MKYFLHKFMCINFNTEIVVYDGLRKNEKKNEIKTCDSIAFYLVVNSFATSPWDPICQWVKCFLWIWLDASDVVDVALSEWTELQRLLMTDVAVVVANVSWVLSSIMVVEYWITDISASSVQRDGRVTWRHPCQVQPFQALVQSNLSMLIRRRA